MEYKIDKDFWLSYNFCHIADFYFDDYRRLTFEVL